MKSLILQALKTFQSRRRRTLLTMLGIIIGVAGVVTIGSLGKGAEGLITGQLTKLGSNLITILPGKSDDNGPPAAVFGIVTKTLSDYDVLSLRDTARAPYISAVAPIVSGSFTISYEDKEIDTSVQGTTADLPKVQSIPLETGSFLDSNEDLFGQSIVIGYDVKNELFPGEDPLGKVVKIKNLNFRVVGVMAEQGRSFFQDLDNLVYIPFKTAQKQLLGIDYIQFVRIKSVNEESVTQAMADTRTVLRENHRILDIPEGDDFSVRSFGDLLALVSGITGGLRAFLGFMAGISLVVGGIGIMNVMLVSVQERTREIGLRKALGATPRDISRQFLVETCILSLVGGTLGIAIGILISYLISLGVIFAGYDWVFGISVSQIAVPFLVSACIGIVFGWYPAKKAAQLDPIEALRHE